MRRIDIARLAAALLVLIVAALIGAIIGALSGLVTSFIVVGGAKFLGFIDQSTAQTLFLYWRGGAAVIGATFAVLATLFVGALSQ